MKDNTAIVEDMASAPFLPGDRVRSYSDRWTWTVHSCECGHTAGGGTVWLVYLQRARGLRDRFYNRFYADRVEKVSTGPVCL